MRPEKNTVPPLRSRAPLAALLAAGLAAGCGDVGGGGGAGSGAAPTAAGTSSAAAKVAFTTSRIDLGVITDTRTHELSFPFSNSGGGQLVISQVKGDCGCTVPSLSRTVFPPGDGDSIEVLFNPKGKKGPEDRTITVISNGEPQTVKLKFTADIRPMLEFDTMYQFGTMALHQEHRRTIPMRYTDPDLVIKEVRTNNPAVRARLVETGAADGERDGQPAYRATVQLTVADDAPWGVFFANKLFLDVRGRPLAGQEPVEYTYEMSLLGTIIGELQAQPTILTLGSLQSNQAYEKSTVIRNTQDLPFTVIDAIIAETTMPGMQVRVEPAGATAHKVTVFGNVGGFRGWVRGRLAIQTDVESEGILTIPISGLIK
ncbi:MAG: DUF1573 domain-containing protein [Planctomycetota bacterium]|jgi:hypothetical protein